MFSRSSIRGSQMSCLIPPRWNSTSGPMPQDHGDVGRVHLYVRQARGGPRHDGHPREPNEVCPREPQVVSANADRRSYSSCWLLLVRRRHLQGGMCVFRVASKKGTISTTLCIDRPVSLQFEHWQASGVRAGLIFSQRCFDSPWYTVTTRV